MNNIEMLLPNNEKILAKNKIADAKSDDKNSVEEKKFSELLDKKEEPKVSDKEQDRESETNELVEKVDNNQVSFTPSKDLKNESQPILSNLLAQEITYQNLEQNDSVTLPVAALEQNVLINPIKLEKNKESAELIKEPIEFIKEPIELAKESKENKFEDMVSPELVSAYANVELSEKKTDLKVDNFKKQEEVKTSLNISDEHIIPVEHDLKDNENSNQQYSQDDSFNNLVVQEKNVESIEQINFTEEIGNNINLDDNNIQKMSLGQVKIDQGKNDQVKQVSLNTEIANSTINNSTEGYPSITDQLKVHIQQGGSKSGDIITVQLKPENLGRVDVKIEVVGQETKMSVDVENRQTYELLKQSIKELENSILKIGINDSVTTELNLRDQGKNNQPQDNLYKANHRLFNQEEVVDYNVNNSAVYSLEGNVYDYLRQFKTVDIRI